MTHAECDYCGKVAPWITQFCHDKYHGNDNVCLECCEKDALHDQVGDVVREADKEAEDERRNDLER